MWKYTTTNNDIKKTTKKKQSTFIVKTKTLLQNIIFYLHIGMKVTQVWNNIGWENDDRVILRLLNNIIVLTDILTELLFFLFSFTILFVLVNLLCAFVILIHFFKYFYTALIFIFINLYKISVFNSNSFQLVAKATF